MTDLEDAALAYARALADATRAWGNDPQRRALDDLLQLALTRLCEQAVIFAEGRGQDEAPS